jgi:nucleoid DNA-binding protein
VNVTKEILVEQTAKKCGRPKTECKTVIDVMLDTILISATKTGPVEIRDFGTFYVKERKPRPARNPRTGKLHPLPRRNVLLFRFSPEIRNYINPEADHEVQPGNAPAPIPTADATPAKEAAADVGGGVLPQPPPPLPNEPKIPKAEPGQIQDKRNNGALLDRLPRSPKNAGHASTKILEKERGYTGQLGGNR